MTFEATETQNGDYEYKSDASPLELRGIVSAHPPFVPPPPPPPPPSPAGPPPPPPPPPQQPDLIATAGPDQKIAIFYSDGRRATRIPPGTYTIQVHDLSTSHNFHLKGPGVDMSTEVGEIVHPIWRVTFVAGTYTFKCDVHSTVMRGTLTVAVGAPPPTKCHVPRVIGMTLGRARRQIRARHCAVGRVRYLRSSRARGRVVRQAPKGGRTLARGTRVSLYVSRGPG